jgi:hypothetical protein
VIVTWEPISRAAVAHILANLRPHDRHEILAQRWNDDMEALADDVMAMACNPLWRVYLADGEPVALIGATLVRPGVCAVGGFGTTRWSRVLRPLSRYVMDELIPALLSGGVHRAETYVMAANKTNLRWITALGGEVEGVLRGYGRGGEDFVALGWRGDHVLENLRWRRWERRSAEPTIHEVGREHGDGRSGHPAEVCRHGDHHDRRLANPGQQGAN